MEEDRKWTHECLEFMMMGEYESGLNLKMKHFPKSFFKYKSLSNNTLNALKANELWLSDIISLNDPFEGSLQFDNDECLRLVYGDVRSQDEFERKFGFRLTASEIAQIVKSPKPYLMYSEVCRTKNIIMNSPEQQLNIIQRRWEEIMEEMNRNIRVSCFTEDKDNLLMWSHYADQHMGICLEYDFKNEGILRTFTQPVCYKNQSHKIGVYEELTILRVIGTALVKSLEWKYEKEWRCIVFKQDKIFPRTISIPDPKAIYLGARFAQRPEYKALADELLLLMNEREVPIYYMTKHSTEFRIIKAH